nr:polysaccharide biosynthesis C-terminal domain-containing protein [Roseivirga sp. E12]
MAFGTNGEIIVMSKYYRFNVVTVSILAMLTISFNLWLIPEYGIEGAAIASFLSMLLFNVIKYIFVFAKFGIQPFTRSSIVFVIIAAFTLLVNYFLPSISNIYLDIMVRSLAIVIVLMGLTFGLKVSSELNQLLSTTLSRVISKR